MSSHLDCRECSRNKKHNLMIMHEKTVVMELIIYKSENINERKLQLCGIAAYGYNQTPERKVTSITCRQCT